MLRGGGQEKEPRRDALLWPWADPDGALEKYLAQKDALHAGRKLRTDADASTVKALVNDFVNRKQALVDSGELSLRTWRDYKETCDTLVSCLGKHRLAADVGPDANSSRRASKRELQVPPSGMG